MERRRFLAAAGVGVTGPLAGCTGVLDDETAPERNPANEVTDNIRTAVGLANTAALSLDSVETDFEDPDRIEFDENEPRDRLAEARTALDDAEADDDGSHETEIVAAQAYVGIVESMIEMFVELLDSASELADSDESFDPDDIDRLRESITGARDPIERAVSARTAGSEYRDSADESTLTDLDAEFETVTDGFDELVAFTDGFDVLTTGYATLLDGVEYVETAQEQFSAEEYDDARGGFADATAAFDAANSTFTDGRSDAHEELDGEFDRATGRSDSLFRLSSSHESMLDGRELLEDGKAEFENEDFEAASAAFSGAQEEFTAASEALDAEPRPDGEFDAEFDQAQCRADNLGEAAEEFAAAADAADQGDFVEADQRFEDGEDALEAAENC
ncbi:hypothetical protein [Natranaeroarchaeum sulfidigenes]|uniref:Uncharacterized protein n=1 Tax=Natranaeroarchaeum sulfidigenes TaxID=2784880 RepID=A0A897MRH5_9EURY|nr:hypothetical protein [Natranaeroarchaeum sulfidigenes]QSG01623.1 Uncharacterized protein AArcS_0394 [Natranaeroarchaeum sulfidigenes]